MHRVSVKAKTEQLEQWKQAAKRERLTLAEWLVAAAELAIARGSTR